MSQPWKVPRSHQKLAIQWARRAVGQSLPFLAAEVNRRMISRAEIMRPTEGPVISHGWAHPEVVSGLQALFPGRIQKAVVPDSRGLEWQNAVNTPAPSLYARLLKKISSASPQADSSMSIDWMHVPLGGRLPVEPESVGLIWSLLWLHSVEEPNSLMHEWARVLAKQGCVFFSCFGPDTAVELKQAANQAGLSFPDFADMHDIGDSLAQCGFSDPVMEMERLTLTYESQEKLLGDWRSLVGNNLQQPQAGLLGKQAYERFLHTLAVNRQADGRYTLTLELVYGHAWKVKSFRQGVQAAISPSEIGGRRAK